MRSSYLLKFFEHQRKYIPTRLRGHFSPSGHQCNQQSSLAIAFPLALLSYGSILEYLTISNTILFCKVAVKTVFVCPVFSSYSFCFLRGSQYCAWIRWSLISRKLVDYPWFGFNDTPASHNRSVWSPLISRQASIEWYFFLNFKSSDWLVDLVSDEIKLSVEVIGVYKKNPGNDGCFWVLISCFESLLISIFLALISK